MIAAAGALACPAPRQTGTPIRDGMRVDDAFGEVYELAQGWTDDTQQMFYNTPQGSHVLPYAWFLALEQARTTTPFLDRANIERFRYLPRMKTSSNPDGLPVGWTKGTDASGQAWLGFTCAACHTTQLEYQHPETRRTVAIRVDGAPTLADFELMNVELVAALQATIGDGAKFDRFARAVLGAGDAPNARAALLGELKEQTDVLATRNEINKADVAYGFARIDAIGFILNQTMATLPGMPENARPSDAPASYPFLWGTDQSDVVQWTGFAANLDGAGILVRNGGEVVGVYGKVVVTSAETYESSLMIENLSSLENAVRELAPPAWPAHVFPRVDQAKAAEGAKLYAAACARCHQVIAPGAAIKTTYHAVITPRDEIKTDPTELDNLTKRTYVAGVYAGKKAAVLGGDVIADPTTGLDPLVNIVAGSLLAHKREALEAFVREHAARTGKPRTSVPGYKGRPLNGVWATAPYLHNGSVPNLYELLLPPAERSQTFTLGSRAFDPVRVGFAMDQPSSATDYTPFTFDVRIRGNANTGHEYLTKPDGTTFTDEERWQLVEYMKTL